MSNECISTPTPHKKSSYGAILKAARESKGLSRQEMAAQLRLNEKIIIMMEHGKYSADLPYIFIKGYIRSYSKLLEIPEYEVHQALAPIKPKVDPLPQPAKSPEKSITSTNYLMLLFTFFIVLTLLGLIGGWWHAHFN